MGRKRGFCQEKKKIETKQIKMLPENLGAEEVLFICLYSRSLERTDSVLTYTCSGRQQKGFHHPIPYQ